MMKVLKKIRLVYHMIRLISKPNSNIKSLLYVSDKIGRSKASQNAVTKLFRSDELQRMYSNSKGLSQLSLNVLRSYPKESFGREVYHFYKKSGLDIYPMKADQSLSRENYISERTRKTHDILHILLDYGTDLIGEAKVNAFVARQTRMPISFLIICGIVILFFLKKPLQFQHLIKEINEGWKRGGELKNFLHQDWEDLMFLPSDLVRYKLRKQEKRFPFVIKKKRRMELI